MSVALEHNDQLDAAGDQRDNQIQTILNEVRAQRAAGQQVLDEDIIARHPDLPELVDALGLLKKIQKSFRQVMVVRPEAGQNDGVINHPRESSESESLFPPISGYRLGRQIDRGGQAVVFLAVQESTQRKVAIKVLDGGAFVTQHKQDRFEREVKALVALDHPGIVRIIDRGRTVDGSFFIAMDYVDGEDLDVYLEQRRKEGWKARQVTELFVKIASALGEAHRLGIIHRDIKPSNIRIDARGEPRILDFGLARLTTSVGEENPGFTVTQTGGVVGSLPWASPEQASGDSARLCPASDVYSLGVAFYRALTGHSPYDLSGTLRKQMHNICEVVVTFPAKSASSLPFGPVDPQLAGVILKCLEKQTLRRYCDGTSLASELENYLAGRSQMSFSRPRRRRIIIATLAILMALLGVAATVTWSPRGDDKSETKATKLPTIRNSLGMELVLIPAGTFYVTNIDLDQARDPNEHLRQITLTRPYYIATTEVTRAEYRQVMHALPKNVIPFPNDDRLPVDYISREQAEEFCRILSGNEHGHYRLPTEAEWENASRDGANTVGQIDGVAWHAGNSGGRLEPVGSKQPNNWGLYDTHGSVSEWCADGFMQYSGNGRAINPFTPAEPMSFGVVRGGIYLEPSSHSNADTRIALPPDQSVKGVGFRVALDSPSSRDSRASH